MTSSSGVRLSKLLVLLKGFALDLEENVQNQCLTAQVMDLQENIQNKADRNDCMNYSASTLILSRGRLEKLIEELTLIILFTH